MRGGDDLDRLEARVFQTLEEPLAGAQQDRYQIQGQLVDRTGRQRLTRRRGAAADRDLAVGPGSALGLLQRSVKTLCYEVEGRTALHLYRIMGVVGEYEHRCVIGRLVAPPSAPVLVPLTPHGSEHVAAHDVRASASQQIVAGSRVDFVSRLPCPEVPLMELHASDPEGVVATLVGTGDEAVKRDGHMACDLGHGNEDLALGPESSLLTQQNAWQSGAGRRPATGCGSDGPGMSATDDTSTLLTTGRIMLRPWRADEADRFFDLHRREEVARWLSAPPLKERSQALELIERNAARLEADPRFGAWAIVERTRQVPAGTVLLKPLPDGDGEIEIGWQLHPDSWGKGLATEAAGARLERAFADGLDEVWAVTHLENRRSIAVCHRIGLRLLGITHRWYHEPSSMFWGGASPDREPSLSPDAPAPQEYSGSSEL